MHTFNPSILEDVYLEADLVYKGRSKIASLLQEKPFLKTKTIQTNNLYGSSGGHTVPRRHSYKVMLYMKTVVLLIPGTMGQEPDTAIMEPWKPQSDRAMLLWKRRLSSHKHSY